MADFLPLPQTPWQALKILHRGQLQKNLHPSGDWSLSTPQVLGPLPTYDMWYVCTLGVCALCASACVGAGVHPLSLSVSVCTCVGIPYYCVCMHPCLLCHCACVCTLCMRSLLFNGSIYVLPLALMRLATYLLMVRIQS